MAMTMWGMCCRADAINGVLDATNTRSYDALNRMIHNTQGNSRQCFGTGDE